MARTDVVPIAVLTVLMLVLITGVASAGSETEPEIWDDGEPEGDNNGGDLDIISAWFTDEDEENVLATLLLHSLPPVQTETDTVEYEIYFSIGDSNFSVVAIFDVATGATEPDYELRSITYDNGSVITENNVAGINGDWDSGDGTITFEVPKDTVEALEGGEATHTWAAVWVTPTLGGGGREISDVARTFNEHGWNYYFAGLHLNGTAFEETILPGGSVVFSVTLSNPGEQNLTINFSNTYDTNWNDYHAEKWDATATYNGLALSPNFTATLYRNESVLLEISINVPSDPESTVMIDLKPAIVGSIMMEYWLFQLNNTKVSQVDYQVLANTTGDGPGPDGDDDDDDDDEFMFGLTTMQFAAVSVVLVIVLLVIVKIARG